MVQRLQSEIDDSINFVETVDIGKLESRFVRRVQDYFITYISSQTGCDQACRMCHLTSTGQNKLRDATMPEMVQQAAHVLNEYRLRANPAKYVHFNFMARGEPLNNQHMVHDNQMLFKFLDLSAMAYGLESKFLVSTILPASMPGTLSTVFDGDIKPFIYYSLYSMDTAFRRRWLPRAIDPNEALAQLKEFSVGSENQPKIHFAFIEGENDSVGSVERVCEAMVSHDARFDVNIVRYNPYSAKQGVESSEDVIERNAQLIRDVVGCNVKVIPKVGFDVKASCGMFV